LRERTEVVARTPVRQQLIWTVAGFGTLAFAACLFGPLVGSTRIHLSAVFDRSIPYADNVDAQIFFVARLPRVLAAALVGSALALSGVVFQALLRNPLASPDTLGRSGAPRAAWSASAATASGGVGVIAACKFSGDWNITPATSPSHDAHQNRPGSG
jgi:iron complex transport system permease protein